MAMDPFSRPDVFLAALQSDDGFRARARFMSADVTLRCEDREVFLSVREGTVKQLDGSPVDAIVFEGDRQGWESLALPGGLQRAFRHKTMAINGNRIAALQHWKAMVRLCELVAEETL